ncbi:hypothetical protein [Peribacillus sp. Hz7]|uniref:hypothetical protein n=1 Tax=Peribacillus sp. Hz7 TaxID=3344873 RepID=UPI0035CB6672
MGDLIKNGVSFNLKHIRENNEDIWNKYKDVFIEGFPAVEKMDEVYMNELSEYIDGKIVFAFLNDLLPKEFLEEMARYKKNYQIDIDS